MTHEQICEALVKLGFITGWVLSGTDYENIVWINEQPKPSFAELHAALGL